MLRKLSIILLFAVLASAAALPLAAQTATPDPNNEVVVVGTVDLGQGVIMVNNYVIAPASAFQPAILHDGDLVVVIGYLLPDGITIRATSLEFFDDSPMPEATPEVTPEVTPEMTPEVTPEATLEVTPEATATVCGQVDQPVAQRLATAFDVSYDEIIGWHCAGFGFGEIARAYLLADASGLTPETYFNERLSGQGWGQIIKEAGVHPSELAPGQVIRPNHDQGDDGPGNSNGRGNSGNNGNGRGNNGNNGNNGNGRGNSGNNGKN